MLVDKDSCNSFQREYIGVHWHSVVDGYHRYTKIIMFLARARALLLLLLLVTKETRLGNLGRGFCKKNYTDIILLFIVWTHMLRLELTTKCTIQKHTVNVKIRD